MKIILLFTLFTTTILFGQNVSFTDINFKKAIIRSYPNVDADKDGEISYDEAKTLTVIRNLYNIPKITNTKGLEAFVNLRELDLKWHALTSIDISSNTNLEILNIRENQLSGILDLSALKKIYSLEVNFNQLTGITFSPENNLHILYANENNLSVIDLSTLKNLKRLFLVRNKITKLDISQNTILERLHIDDNEVKTLDFTNLNRLNWVSVNRNGLTGITFHNNPSLKTILAQENNLTLMNIQDGISNNFTFINVSSNPNFNTIIKDCSDTVPHISGVTVQDNCNLTTEDSTSKKITIYPNPAKDFVKVQNVIKAEYILYSLDGKIIKSGILNNENIDLRDISRGPYILKVFDKNHHISQQKLILE